MGEPTIGGTLTFLFTDIEASTRRWQQHPEAMREALVRHDSLIAGAVEGMGGRIFKHTGDGVCCVFSSARAAIDAAVHAQRAIAAQVWEEVGGLRVRMALHTGEAEERDGDYFGQSLNRVARVMAVAHGGQILVSDATASLLRDGDLDVVLRDLGEHELRDIARPERLHQVEAPGLDHDFPPPRTGEVVQHNLPAMRTSFVGRGEAVGAVVELVRTERLVSLVGIGGTGKTRLALEVAQAVLGSFPGGVYFVDLSAIVDGSLVLTAVAGAIGAVVTGVGDDTSVEEIVVAALATRRTLLVVDNCEHLIGDAADVVDMLLERCPGVTVLATTREALDVEGERTWPVPSLPSTEARELFVARARAADARFALDEGNLAHVEEVCRRLDGIPLAIELAAARVAHLAPADLVARLDDRFRLLTGGHRRRAQRQQTLQAAIDWSHDLLNPAEQTLLRRLSVFAGGFTLAAVDGMALTDGDAVDLLGSLVAKSLVAAEVAAGVTRYRMLETIRIYAADRLFASGEADEMRTRHRDWFLAWIESRPMDHLISRVDVALELEAELDNIRVALDWSEATRALDEGVRIATSLLHVWALRGRHQEAITRLARLAAEPSLSDAQRARCLGAQAFVEMARGQSPAMSEAARACVALDPEGPLAPLSLAHLALAGITDPGRYDEGIEGSIAAEALARRLDQPSIGVLAIGVRCYYWLLRDELDKVKEAATATPATPTFGDLNVRMPAVAAFLLSGDPDGALLHAEIAVEMYSGSFASSVMGMAALELGDRETAEAYAALAAREHLELPVPLAVGDCLVLYAALALHDGDPERAAVLLEAVWGALGFAAFRSPASYALWRWYRHRAKRQLDREVLARARALGAAMDADTALREEMARQAATTAP
ncbi:MAG TPA: adenylate/guanylate cyclase domain-containing protein [Acidimicrobiales bacterium]|nr:adenylate/guanylate cyclase domain-containing protein [Acidimicrobiales bacterium]